MTVSVVIVIVLIDPADGDVEKGLRIAELFLVVFEILTDFGVVEMVDAVSRDAEIDDAAQGATEPAFDFVKKVNGIFEIAGIVGLDEGAKATLQLIHVVHLLQALLEDRISFRHGLLELLETLARKLGIGTVFGISAFLGEFLLLLPLLAQTMAKQGDASANHQDETDDDYAEAKEQASVERANTKTDDKPISKNGARRTEGEGSEAGNGNAKPNQGQA